MAGALGDSNFSTGCHRPRTISDPKNLSFRFEGQNLSITATSTNQTNFVRELTVWYMTSMVCCSVGSLMCITLVVAVREDWKRSLREITEDRNGTRLLIVHATVIGMLVCLFHFVSFTQIFYGQRYRVSRTGCIFIQLPFALSRTVGYWSSAYLSFNRLLAICFPVLYRNWFAQYVINTGVISVMWLISFGIFIPVVAGWGSRFEAIPPLYACGVEYQVPEANLINFALAVYTPLSLTGLLYALIIGFSFYQQVTSAHGSQRSSRRRPFRLAMILLVAALWHCICFLPHTGITAFDRTKLVARYPELALWLRLIFMLGYVGNAVVFFGMNRDYKTTLQKWAGRFFRRLRHGSERVDPALNTTAKAQLRNPKHTSDCT